MFQQPQWIESSCRENCILYIGQCLKPSHIRLQTIMGIHDRSGMTDVLWLSCMKEGDQGRLSRNGHNSRVRRPTPSRGTRRCSRRRVERREHVLCRTCQRKCHRLLVFKRKERVKNCLVEEILIGYLVVRSGQLQERSVKPSGDLARDWLRKPFSWGSLQ